jgi:EmrB/QacA subfamily drug resistance transporter
MRSGGRSSKTEQRMVLAATILGSSMAFIDGTVVNVALPALQNALHASISDVQWVVEGYALMLAALLLVGGSLGDALGRRKIYVCGVVVFAAASAWCGCSATAGMLIMARIVQGAGAALLVPGSLALITATFPEETRGQAIGTWSGFSAMTAALGPVLGGWLIQHVSWRWVFFLNLPLALAVVLLCLGVPESRNARAAHERLDWLGALLATVGLGGVTFALIEWPSHSGHGVRILAAALVGVVALAAFGVVERRLKAPMLSFALFRSRNFSGANLLTLFLYAALNGLMFFLPMELIQVRHYTATEAGAALLPFVVLMFGLSRWAGGLVARYGSRLPLTIGPIVAACGLAGFALVAERATYWTGFFPAVLVLGLGMTISVAPLTTTVMNAVPDSESGVASGINNAVSRLAALLAVAVFGAILITVFNRALDHRLIGLSLTPAVRAAVDAARPQLAAAHSNDAGAQRAIVESFVEGFRVVLWMAAGFAALSGVLAWFMIEARAKK